MLDQPLIILDVETTGANPVYDRITEVGLIDVERGGRVAEWSTLVNPGTRIPPAIQSLTGITDEMVALAPSFEEIAPRLLARLEGKLLVAHNARFDYGFLRNEFRRAGLRYSSRVLCTVKLSRRLFPRDARHNLDALMARHDLACEARHRALGDARAVWLLLDRWRREVPPEAVAAAVDALVRAPAVPAGLAEGALDGIPEAPGVYLFHGENDVVLYVGKSINLRSRVLAHFAGDHREARDMKIAQQVQRVDWIETAGELGALIEEARLVKSLAPVYNRRLRRATELCAWHWRAE
ncbi:MAG: exonuclease domain-containing protein, partial [Burkholderiales bacterium]